MALKEVVCVYQDCYLCGDRGRRQKEAALKAGVHIRKAGFTTKEGKALIHEAVLKHGMGSLPFFTDGEKFSYKLEDFFPKKKVVKKKVKAEIAKEERNEESDTSV